MAAVGDLADKVDRPAIVRFKRVAVEDKAETLARGNGTLVFKDVDYALITPPYSKDIIEMKVSQWKQNLEADVRNGRVPADWEAHYLKQYEAWCNGQEMPLNGTPIRGWSVISPAQQEMLTRINILTVEDLGAANDEGLRRIGMGAIDLRNKARAWVSQAADKGPLTLTVAALQQENDQLKTAQSLLLERLAALEARVPGAAPIESISADDILPKNEPTVPIKRR